MRRFRFSIAGLLGVVLFVGVVFAALRAADDAWDGGLFGLTLLSLATAGLLAVHRTGRRRAYWLGFALFGWTYLGASLVPPVAARLPSTKGLAYLHSKVPGSSVIVLNGEVTYYLQGNAVVSSQQGSTLRLWDARTGRVLGVPTGSTENFVRIGHSLLALVLAFGGGHLSRSLHAGRSGSATMPRVDKFE